MSVDEDVLSVNTFGGGGNTYIHTYIYIYIYYILKGYALTIRPPCLAGVEKSGILAQEEFTLGLLHLRVHPLHGSRDIELLGPLEPKTSSEFHRYWKRLCVLVLQGFKIQA